MLFRAACELGALAGGGAGRRAGRFGEQIGVAFQLLDDILDVTGPPERTGKPRGADLLDGTVTLPLIEARERDPELARSTCVRSNDAAQAAAVCDRIEATGALDFAREQALELVAAPRRAAGAAGAPARRRSSWSPTASSSATRSCTSVSGASAR